MVGYFRLIRAVLDQLADDYTACLVQAMTAGYRLLYLTETIALLRRQGYDVAELENIQAQLRQDVEVEDLDMFFQGTRLGRIICQELDADPVSVTKRLRATCLARIDVEAVKEQAAGDVRRLCRLALAEKWPGRKCLPGCGRQLPRVC